MAKKASKAASFRVLPPYQPRTFISDMEKSSLTVDALLYWGETKEHYGYDIGMPEHVEKKIKAISLAVDKETAVAALKRAKDTILTAVLAAWARGQIDGPVSVHSLERKIKKTENLAKFLESKGQDNAARTQWDALERYKLQLEALMENQ